MTEKNSDTSEAELLLENSSTITEPIPPNANNHQNMNSLFPSPNISFMQG